MDCRLEDDTLIDNGCFQVAIFRLAATQRITWKNNQDELTGTSSEVSIPPTYPLVNIQKAIENGHWSSWLPHYINMVIFHSYVKVYQRVDVRDSGTSGEITQFGWNLYRIQFIRCWTTAMVWSRKLPSSSSAYHWIIAHSPERCSQKLRSTLG